MSKPEKRQAGDGTDNCGQAAKQMANVAKQTGKSTAEQAAVKGAEAAGRTAAATVKAGAETGKAVANIAAGTAAGGPWGAIISTAWSMRHTLYKITVCVCIFIVFLVAVIVSLPSIIFNNILSDIFGIFGSSGDPAVYNAFIAAYSDLSDSVYNTIDSGYKFALDEAERIIIEGGYDYDLSISALEDNAADNRYYDVCYILAAYSASVQRDDSNKADMVYKIESVKADMFPVTYEEKSTERLKDDNPVETETVLYAECIIHEFDENEILKAFGIDLDAKYGGFMTYGEIIEKMADALKMTIYGTTERNLKEGERDGK